MRPRVFIGSASSEDRMRTTMALAHRLQKDIGVIPRVWTYVFPPTESTLSSLITMSREMDFAVFVLGPDDLVLKRPTSNPQGKGAAVEGEIWTTRDNVIFEMGLLIGTLGKERCFAVLPDTPRTGESEKQRRLHLLTDYLGTNYCTYIASKEPGLDPLDTVFAACQEIGGQIQRLGSKAINAFQALFGFKQEAIVVYPHITAETNGIITNVHRGGSSDQEPHRWYVGPRDEERHEVAHFDDLRAVNAIAELCGGMRVNVIATMDGMEQPEIQSLNRMSFSIGLLNGFTIQAFEIIACDSENRIRLRHEEAITQEGAHGVATTRTNSLIDFNGQTYPLGTPHGLSTAGRAACPDGASDTPASASPAMSTGGEEYNANYAIIARMFLRRGGEPTLRFVCGGCQAPGTAVAGVYLKNHWRELLNYYEHFGKDLEEDNLAVLLQFWGRKAESARPEVIRLAFFKASHTEFHQYDRKEKCWKREDLASHTVPAPVKPSGDQRPQETALPPPLPSDYDAAKPSSAGKRSKRGKNARES